MCLAFVTSSCNTSSSKQSQTEPITEVDQLEGAVFAIPTGTMLEELVNSRLPQATFAHYVTPLDAAIAVQIGKEMATAGDYPAMKTIVAQTEGLKLLPEMLTNDEYGMAVALGNYSLKNSLDSLVQALRADGRYDDLCSRWFPDKGFAAPMPVIDFGDATEVIRMGTSATSEPFAFYDDKRELVGFDIELASLLAQSLGKKLVVSNMDFGGLIPSLTAKKVDIIAACITISEERAKSVLFSEPYYFGGISAVIRDTEPDNQDSVKGFIPWITKIGKSIGSSFYDNILKDKRYLLLLDGLLATFLISVFAALFGTVLGVLICAMRMSKNNVLKDIAVVYITFFRGIPQVVLLMIMFYVVFASSSMSGSMVASITFALNFSAYVSEIFRSAMQGIPKGQREAGEAIGFSKFSTFRFIILPQTVARALPVYKGEFISMVKMTSIVGYIAVQDLTKAGDIIRSRTFDAFFPLIAVAILYFLISWLLTQALKLIEINVIPKTKPASQK